MKFVEFPKRLRRLMLITGTLLFFLPTTLWAMESYLMIPFLNMAQIYGENQQASSPYSFRVYRTGPVDVNGLSIVASEFQSQLTGILQYSIGSIADGEQAINEVLKVNPKLINTPRDLAIQAGKKEGVGNVVVGAVYVYRERVGRDFSVETPASITFEISLYRVADGVRLWTQSVTEIQQPLSENVLNFGKFMKRKGAWLTAEALTRSNIQNIIKTFPFSQDVLERKAMEEGGGTLPPPKAQQEGK